MILASKNDKPYLKYPKSNTQSASIIRVFLVGSPNAGKSCFMNQSFTPGYTPTIGIDFRNYDYNSVNGLVKYQIWDCSGNPNWFHQIETSLRMGDIFIFMYDQSSEQSFIDLENLRKDLIQRNQLKPAAKGMILGNKSDLEACTLNSERVETLEEKIGVHQKISVKNSPNSLSELFDQIYLIMKDQSYRTIFERSEKFTAPIEVSPSPPQNYSVAEPKLQHKFLIKTLLLGDVEVGKTALLHQFTQKQFLKIDQRTIGVDFKVKQLESNGVMTKLQIWDTSGQQVFRTITSSYIIKAKIILLVYDCCNRQSFERISLHLKKIETHHEGMADSYICLVANKCDLSEKRVVSEEEGINCSGQFGLNYAQCSATQFQSISSILQNGVDWLIKNHKLEEVKK